MSTLITGGAGFIGIEVVRTLLERGEDRPAIFSRSADLSALPDLEGRVEVMRGDVGNFSHVLDAVKRSAPEVIYHFSAMLSVPSEADPAGSFHTNVTGTMNVLEAARLFGVQQVIFASSIGTYGYGITTDHIDDLTIQRPALVYGVGKVFGELMGSVYQRKFGIDFRGIRYPSIVGAGVRTPGVVQFTSWIIEHAHRGEPFTINIGPGYRIPIVYIKEAGRAAVDLAQAPAENIQAGMYLIDGPKPTPTAAELVESVQKQLPGADIRFEPDPQINAVLDEAIKPIDDSRARSEWGWEPVYTYDEMVRDVVSDLERHPGQFG